MNFDINKIIRNSVHYIEAAISAIVLVAVLAGIPDVFRYIFIYIKSTDGAFSYQNF